MAGSSANDKSNGYEEIAHHFVAARNNAIGPSVVREWCRKLPGGCTVLDLACGHGVPITQVLVEEGLNVYAIDASPTLLAAFRKRFPELPTDCASFEDSAFFGRTFDAVIVWGLMFLLTPDQQAALIQRVAGLLNPGGKFLFTSTEQEARWMDSLTDRESISLGAARYRQLIAEAGLELEGEAKDEGENHYFFLAKPP